MIMEDSDSIAREAATVMEEPSISWTDSSKVMEIPANILTDSFIEIDMPSDISSEPLIIMEEPKDLSSEPLIIMEEPNDLSSMPLIIMEEPNSILTDSLMVTEASSDLLEESHVVTEVSTNILSDASTVIEEPITVTTDVSSVTEETINEQDLAGGDQPPTCDQILTSQFRATQFPCDEDTYKHDVINDRTLLPVVENIISPLTDIFTFAAHVDDNTTIPPESDEDALFRMNAKSYFSSRVAVCEFVHDWISHHPPHAFQQIIRCMSYWRTRQLEFEQSQVNAEKVHDNNQRIERTSMESAIFLPVLIWPGFAYGELAYSKAKSFRRMNKSHDWRPVVTNEFTIGILDEIASEFDVLITTSDNMADDVYHRLLQIEKFQYHQFITASGEHENITNPYDNKMYYGDDEIEYNFESYSILGSDYNSIKADDSLYYLSDADYIESSSTTEVEILQDIEGGNDEQTIASNSFPTLPELTNQTLEILRQVLIEATVTMNFIDKHVGSYTVHNAPSDVHYYTDRIKSKYNFTLNSQLVPKSIDDNFHSIEATSELKGLDTKVAVDMEQISNICEQLPIMPRIGILNRRPESIRSLLNIDAIANALENELLHMDENIEKCYILGKISKPTVNVAYFEWGSFQSQIEFYSSVDILLTPHGAQETGLFFMPRCGAILELFPKGYHIPMFFGYLARMSSIAHYTGYISDSTDIEEDLKHGFAGTAYEQSCARSVNLCPQVPPITDYMMNTIVQDWQKCMTKRRRTRYQISHVR
jgi:Glycosyltransferase 61